MVRRVVSNNEVPHLWAHQTQDRASGYGNLSFEGTVLSSYATPIANLVKDRKGNTVALISENRYSSSTGKHLNYAQRACGYGDASFLPSYTVPYIGASGGYAPRIGERYNGSETQPKVFHAANAQFLLNKYQQQLASAKRRLQAPAYGDERRDLEEIARTAREYAERFGVDRRKIRFPDVAADFAEVQAKRDARNTPEAVAKREKDAEKRRERERRDYREARGKYDVNWSEPHRFSWQDRASIFTDEDKAARGETLGVYWKRYVDEHRAQFRAEPFWRPECDESAFTAEDREARKQAEAAHWQQYVAEHRERFRTDPRFSSRAPEELYSEEDRAARQATIERLEADQIAAWYRGERVYLSHGDSARLRIVGGDIETSWGVRFPVEHGRKAFPLIARIRQSGREYQRNGHTIHLGHYAIDRVTVDGTVFAGCHIVKWPEIERVARELGLIGEDGEPTIRLAVENGERCA